LRKSDNVWKTLHRDDRTAAELVAEALIANQSDVIVAALGESAEMSGESSSRILKSTSTRKTYCKNY
jgi:hypothetical protein